MKERAQELVVESTKDIHDNDRSIAQQETLSKISITAKVLRFLSQKDIQDVYNNLTQKSGSDEQEQKTRKAFILDAMTMAGTYFLLTQAPNLLS
jgi:uncharacterized protein YbaP (TraB family)